MRQKSGPEKQPAEVAIRDIRRATGRHFSADEKIRVVLEGLRGEERIALWRGFGGLTMLILSSRKELAGALTKIVAGAIIMGSRTPFWPHFGLRAEDRSRWIAFSNGSSGEALPGVDALGCLCYLRARLALDGVRHTIADT